MEAPAPNDTIAALSSGSGIAGVAVIRLSGPSALAVVEALSRQPVPPPREMALRSLHAPDTGELLDRALVVAFPAPASFTGEHVAEIHAHGGPAVVEGLLSAILAHPSRPRLAEPGEFTRRAYDNNKFDLTAVEGLADLLHARTEGQRRQALSAAGGEAFRTLHAWRNRLLEARAYVETAIDFVDEDVPDDLLASARSIAAEIEAAMAAELARAHAGQSVRDGVRIAIVGAPNAGKSTLINRLSAREVAIVSDQPGTTRDALETAISLAGQLVWLVDTAGVRSATSDTIEAEGIRRAQQAREDAHIVLEVIGEPTLATAAPDPDERPRLVRFLNKSDAISYPATAEGLRGSAKSGVGIAALIQALEDRVRAATADGENAVIQRLRHRTAIESAAQALADCEEPFLAEELFAANLKHATTALDSIVGNSHIEDVLDIIFGEFCIGK